MGSIGNVSTNNLDYALAHIKDINPYFKPNTSIYDPEGYNNNCVMCAITFEAMARGEKNIEAKNFVFGDVDMLNKVRNADKAFENAEVWDVGRDKREQVVNGIEDLMLGQDFGNGSRAIIQIRSTNNKHTMNVINDNGEVKVVDSQNGTQGSVAKMLKGLKTKNVYLFRVDNKKLKDDYANMAYRRK